MIRVLCPSPAATAEVGERLGRLARPGTVIGLQGDLGAGKTVFAKGLGRGLKVASDVVSPTFILVAVHEGRLPLWHADFYRLEEGSNLDDLALEDADEGVLVVEWFGRFPEALPTDRLEIRIGFSDEGRIVELRPCGPRHEALLEAFGEP